MHSSDRVVADFVAGLERKNLPIDSNDAYQFGHAFLERNPPAGWLNRLVTSAQYIDKPTFDRNVTDLAEIAKDHLKGREYAVSLTDRNKSDYWIYQQMLRLGLPKAAELFDWEKDERLDNRIWDPSLKWLEQLPSGMPVCSFDDFTISGSQLYELLDGFPKDGKEENLFVCLATNLAKRTTRARSINIFQSGADISQFSETFGSEDLSFLSKLYELSSDWSVFFWTWYKVPDNVPRIFTGTDFPPLIRKERFQPPYKLRR